MGDGRAERRLARGADRIGMDKLIVQRRAGEGVDLILGDRVPIAGGTFDADRPFQHGQGVFGSGWHVEDQGSVTRWLVTRGS